MYELRHIDELIRPGQVLLEAVVDRNAVAKQAVAQGLTSEAAGAVAEHMQRCASALSDGTARSDRVFAAFVPGRVEVLGKHTDYAGGGSLICTVQRGISIVVAPRRDRRVEVTDAVDGSRAVLEFAASCPPKPGHWSDYIVSVCRRLARDFPEAERGADITFSSNLPRASGMSSSASLTVAFALALIAANDLANSERFRGLFVRPEDLAQYLGSVENGMPYLNLRGDVGVGTFGGSEDHTAILCSQPGMMKWYSYAPVRFHEAVAVPDNHRFVLAFSGLHAEKTGAVLQRYNYLSASTNEVAAAWRRAMDRDEPHLGAVSAVPGYSRTEVALAIRDNPGERYTVRELTDRLDAFHHENNLILPGAVEALEHGRLDRFGELVDRSQNLAEELLKNQTPETVHLVREGRLLGAIAASAFGAGFGGSVWAMVSDDRVEDFVRGWSSSYRTAFPEPAANAVFFADPTGPAAFFLS